MLLITFFIYFQNIFIAQGAVMKITNLPFTDRLKSQKNVYQAIYDRDGFKYKHEFKRDKSFPETPVCKEEIKPDKPIRKHECLQLPIDQKVFRATRLNGDAYIERKSEKEKQLQRQGGGRPKFFGKREAFSNLTANSNVSGNLSTANLEVDDSYDKVSKLTRSDFDNFYDNELIRKLSDSSGKLPTSLKLVMPPDKEPIVVYNESEDDSFNSRNFIKREAVTPNSKAYYDYYEEQSDNIQLNSGSNNARQKNSNDRVFMNEQVRSSNDSIDNSIKEINMDAKLNNNTLTTPAPENFVSFEPITLRKGIKEYFLKNRSKIFHITGNSGNKKKVSAQRKATCPSAAPGKEGCHPGSGLPKNPMMPSLIQTEKDPEYEKLMRGETSERVIRAIVDKIHKKSNMATELGICEFNMAEVRNMFKKIRNRDKKECCAKLSGEFKCFLNWLLTMEPSRKKRSGAEEEGTSNRFSTCNQFPKFDIMAGECYQKPSPQYEKLVQRVEEYRDENSVK